jgi:hypothetical protein
MKHNTFLITAALFCLATSALAADKKENAQPQPQQTEQTQMASSDADASNTSAKSGCPDKPQKHAKHKKQTQPWDESQVPKNQVEYGGGG